MLRVVPGHPRRALIEEAERTGAGLVVLGAHTRRRFVDFGGTTRALLARSPCPVWIQTTPPTHIRRILAPVDMSPGSAVCLETARSVARAFGAAVEVLHAYVPAVYALDAVAGLQDAGAFFGQADLRQAEQEELERHVAALDWTGVEVTSRFQDGDPVETILARHAEFDLIVVGTHGHSAIARALLGSCAYGVVARASRPVLAVPEDERLFLAAGEADEAASRQEAAPCKSPS
jgi:nucleotide-binding universal stress UspA family protein